MGFAITPSVYVDEANSFTLRRCSMNDTLLVVGLAFGLIAVLMFLEVLFRNLFNRVGNTTEPFPPYLNQK